jgi:hypothetical protein
MEAQTYSDTMDNGVEVGPSKGHPISMEEDYEEEEEEEVGGYDQLLKELRQTDKIMEPDVLEVLRRFIHQGGHPSVSISSLKASL